VHLEVIVDGTPIDPVAWLTHRGQRLQARGRSGGTSVMRAVLVALLATSGAFRDSAGG